MSQDILRREWGAVAFLAATALGIVVVPVGLNLNKRNVPAATESLTNASPTASPTLGPTTEPSPPAPPAPSESPSAAPAPAPSPS